MTLLKPASPFLALHYALILITTILLSIQFSKTPGQNQKSHWLSAVDKAMLAIYSTVQKLINSTLTQHTSKLEITPNKTIIFQLSCNTQKFQICSIFLKNMILSVLVLRKIFSNSLMLHMNFFLNTVPFFSNTKVALFQNIPKNCYFILTF